VISIEARAAFLRRIHLFHDISDEDLAVIAGLLKEETFVEDETIFRQGAEADRFYLIYQGAVQISQVLGKEQRALAQLVTGDYFGEQALMANHRHTSTVVATQRSYMFSLTADQFHLLTKKFPRLRAALEVASYSRNLARRLRFNWVRPGEVIYFLARKHEVVLFQSLSSVLLASALPIVLTIYFFLTRSFFAIAAAGLLFLVLAAWALWKWIDWGNDYYILTNQRVIWVERVLGFYDSRQEAPLSTILAVGVDTDQAGRILDYGDVNVRTYTGRIPFYHVSRPYEAAHLVEEQWTRTRHAASRTEKEAMRNVIRQKMGLTVETKVDPREQQDLQVTPTFYRRSLLKVLASHWFNLRVEDSGTVTYRKHWFVLWSQVWEPTVLFFLLVFGLVARGITLLRTAGQSVIVLQPFKVDTLMLVLPVLMIPIILWWIYQYVDWRNDVFQVTPDQIIDIDKKPFGTEERRAAPLENILSTGAERIGLSGYLFNYGTVHIRVGSEHLDFEDVLDPAAVQADVDRRREARIARKRDADAAAERERMSDWLLAYYENEPELRQQQAQAREEEQEQGPGTP
jgi:CRP-like cAMP-binding protein